MKVLDVRSLPLTKSEMQRVFIEEVGWTSRHHIRLVSVRQESFVIFLPSFFTDWTEKQRRRGLGSKQRSSPFHMQSEFCSQKFDIFSRVLGDEGRERSDPSIPVPQIQPGAIVDARLNGRRRVRTEIVREFLLPYGSAHKLAKSVG